MRFVAQVSMPSSIFIFFLICSLSLDQFQFFHFALCAFNYQSSFIWVKLYLNSSVILIKYQRMIKITSNSNNVGLNYRCISHLQDSEVQQLITKFNLTPEVKKKGRQEHLIIKGGVLKKIDPNQLNFTPQETKIIPSPNIFNASNEKIKRKTSEEIKIGSTQQGNGFVKKIQQKKQSMRQSFIHQFTKEVHEDSNTLKQDYCRLWYEKLAIQNQFHSLVTQGQKKDELISQLRQQLQNKNNPQANHFTFNHPPSTTNATSQNKNISHSNYPMPPINATQTQSHWVGVHPNRNFTISSGPIANSRNNF